MDGDVFLSHPEGADKGDRVSSHISNERLAADKVLTDLADYALDYEIKSELAYSTARACLIDTLGCGLEALEYPACTKLLGPIVPGTTVPNGARVPGTPYQLDPVQAAFNIGAMIRWLDFNDTWLAAEWGHPSDNLGGILAVADWLSRSPADGATPGATPEAAPGATAGTGTGGTAVTGDSAFGTAAACSPLSDACEPGKCHEPNCEPTNASNPAAARTANRNVTNRGFRPASAVAVAGSARPLRRGGGSTTGAGAAIKGAFTSAIVAAFSRPPRGIDFHPLVAPHAFSSDSMNSWQLR